MRGVRGREGEGARGKEKGSSPHTQLPPRSLGDLKTRGGLGGWKVGRDGSARRFARGNRSLRQCAADWRGLVRFGGGLCSEGRRRARAMRRPRPSPHPTRDPFPAPRRMVVRGNSSPKLSPARTGGPRRRADRSGSDRGRPGDDRARRCWVAAPSRQAGEGGSGCAAAPPLSSSSPPAPARALPSPKPPGDSQTQSTNTRSPPARAPRTARTHAHGARHARDALAE